MMFLDHCPVCNKADFKPFLDTKDYMITKEDFSIVKCTSCGFCFTNPRPEIDKIGAYYKSEDYISHSSSKKGLVNFIYNLVRNYTLGKKISLIRKTTNAKELLDLGAGTGHFLNQAKKLNFNVQGLEPDEDARKFAKKEFDLILEPIQNLSNITSGSKDVITMWHVLEHVYNLNDDFTELVRVLKKGGFMFIAVPNLKSYDANYYKEFWAAYDLPRHLYHFSENDIKNIAKSFNLELKHVLPMKFDSFYVSMLSEKYKKGSIFKAFWIGLVSNIKAKSYGYSSQIYILQKTKD